MEREFPTSIYWKVIYSIGAIAAAFFAVFLTFKNHPNPNAAGILLSLSLICFAFCVCLNMKKRKISISDYGIRRSGIWGEKEILQQDVKGFKIGDKAIYIETISGGSKISIRDYTTIENSSELIACLSEHFKNLDEIEYKEEMDEIMQDQNLGISERERVGVLKRSRQMSMIYNITGFVLFFLSLVLLRNNQLFDIIVLIYPLAGVLIIILSKGLIKLISKKTSAYYHIFIGMYITVIITLIKSFVDYNIFQYDNLWIPLSVCSITLFVILYLISIKKSASMIVGQVIFALIISIAYSYGVLIKINCNFDKSTSQLYAPLVLEKRIIHGKKDTYYLKIDRWGTRNYVHDTQVNFNLYSKIEIGKHVKIYLNKGFLNIPWFTIFD